MGWDTNSERSISSLKRMPWKCGLIIRRYLDLYTAGTPFISWANLYPRVVATAQNFVRGFLGEKASTLGQVITVNSTSSPLALFDSLAPSDLCPAYVDGNGGTQVFLPFLFPLSQTSTLTSGK